MIRSQPEKDDSNTVSRAQSYNGFPDLVENCKVFCAPRGLLGAWQFGHIVKVGTEKETYYVKYKDGVFKSGEMHIDKFHVSRIAFHIEPSENLNNGLRVISRYLGHQYFAGTIIFANCQTATHTVLFDDGELHRVKHTDIKVAAKQNFKEPWNLAHPGVREDLKNYLYQENYRGRLMLSGRMSDAVEKTTDGYPQPLPFVEHECSERCSSPPEGQDPERYCFDPNMLKTHQPLSVPLFLGWKRDGLNLRNVSKEHTITYTAPCGRILNNLEEVAEYLTITKSDLPIRYFCFTKKALPLVRREEAFFGEYFTDRSFGRENIPVPCVSKNPEAGLVPYFNYLTESVPSEGVKIEDDPEFLVCCDCEDNCQDISKCACRSMTFSEAERVLGENPKGYEHQLLKTKIETGIYECNSRCKCRKTCFNRVVQNPIEIPIEIFYTEKCGWGLRSLVDVEYGSYLFSYVGNIVDPRSSKAFVGGFITYLAEMDLIEMTEQRKQGYEKNYGDLEASEGAKKSNGSPKSTRTYFGETEPYTIDAFLSGNMTRFINHSCTPNIFVQNVFVETHDLRFPRYSFFSLRFIEAGEEFTFDYGENFAKSLEMCHCRSCMGKARKRKRKQQ